MANKIRLGFVGANVRANWASRSHVSALPAPVDIRRRALTTRRRHRPEEGTLLFPRCTQFLRATGLGRDRVMTARETRTLSPAAARLA
jgi:hypothetical protein